MAGSTGYFRVTLPAGGEESVNISAKYLSCLEASGPFEVTANDSSKLYMGAGLSYLAGDGETYQRLRLRDLSGVPNAILLAFGPGELRDQRLTASGVLTVEPSPGAVFDVQAAGGGALPVTPDAGAVFEVAAAGGGALPVTQADSRMPASKAPATYAGQYNGAIPTGWTQILPSNMNRKALIISNYGSEKVHIGDGVTQSMPLAPGETVTIETQAAISIFNPNANSVVIHATGTFI